MRELPTYACTGGPPHDWRRLDVYLDGERVSEVVEVSVEDGSAVRYKLDEAGRPVIKDGAFVRETHHGAYELRWRNSDPGLRDPDQ
jgi:hypothetical protein